MGIISKLRYYADIDLLKSIYYSFFYPYLIYGIQSWGCAHETALATVERQVKKVVRVMCFKEAQEHSIPLFKKVGLMNFKQLFLFEILKFTLKANQNELPNFFNSIFPHLTINVNTRISTRNIRLTKNYFPISRTSYKSRFIGSICSSLWIKLPQEFKLINSYPVFLKEIKSYCLKN